MAGLYSGTPLPDSITLQQMGTDIISPSVGEVQGAVAGQALAGLPTPRLLEQGALAIGAAGGIAPDVPFVPPDLPQPLAPQPATPRPLLDPAEATRRYGVEGRLKFDKPVYEDTAQLLHDQHLAALKREDILARNEGTQFGTGLVARFLPSLAISALDPLNIAAAFVPVMGEARYAQLLAAAGESAFARAGVRAAVGAAQGAVGTAALQPLEFALSRAEMNDYTMTDALASIAMGGALGGGLHVIGGAIGDRYRNPISQRIENAGPGARDTMLRGAVSQHLEDRPVDVLPALEAHELAAREAEVARFARQQQEAFPTELPEAPVARRFTTEPDHEVAGQFVAKDETGRVVAVGESPERAVQVAQAREVAARPEVAQGRPSTPEVSRETIDAATFRREIAAAGGDMGVASDRLAERVGQALDEGRPVTYVNSDSKPVPITAVTRGMMQDAAGLRWGTMDLATDNTGRARVEIGEAGALRADVLREAPAATPAETRQRLLDLQRQEPAPRDPVAAAEAERITRDVPANTDEAAANKMLADAEAELETLRQEGKLPPEAEAELRASEETAAQDEGTAAAMQQAGNCLAERIV
jgi:hypothetical protein